MLRSLKDIMNYYTAARDGELGKVADFYFDDYQWVVRYLVLDTGRWLPGRKVLISPVAIEDASGTELTLHVDLDREQIKDSPSVDEDKPVSRQVEDELATFFRWPVYWGSGIFPSTGPAPSVAILAEQARQKEDRQGDPSLRSAREVLGYIIHTSDENDIGHIDDFIVSDDLWDIRYFVVDTGNIIPGKKILISIHWIESIEFGKSQVAVDITREAIEAAPPFDPAQPLNREVEMRHYDFHGRPYDW